MIVGQLIVLPKHWWEGKDAQGAKRDVSLTTLEPPLGSGPIDQVLRRRPQHGATSASPTTGARTSRQCRHQQFRRAALRVFPRPRSRSRPSRPTNLDWRYENSAKDWATAYDFPAVREKRVILEEFEIRNFGIMQALRVQHCGATSSRIRRCGARSTTRSISRR
jgi:microcin C transport system substrate-binding protein